MTDREQALRSKNPLVLIPQTCARVFHFRGRATRTEFAWFLGACILVNVLVAVAAIAVPAAQPWNSYLRIVGLLAILPVTSLSVRRFHDVNRSGWWVLLTVIPVVGLLAVLFLMFRKSVPEGVRFDGPERGQIRYRLAGASVLGLAVFGAVFQTFWIPAGSMKPTLRIGDYLLVNRLAYRQPCLGQCAGPERGDVAVFRHPTNGKDFIKRIVGVPGDRVQMVDGVLHLNGEPARLTSEAPFEEVAGPQGPSGHRPRCANAPAGDGDICEKERFTEELPGGATHSILNIQDGTHGDNTPEFVVPEGHFFVMGDNRENSIDSRFPQGIGGVGLVPADNILGRADRVIFSSAGTRLSYFWTWRSGRFFAAIE